MKVKITNLKHEEVFNKDARRYYKQFIGKEFELNEDKILDSCLYNTGFPSYGGEGTLHVFGHEIEEVKEWK